MEDFEFDPDKEDARRRFQRRGGAKRRHGNRNNHGHTGSGCNHESIMGLDKMDESEHKEYIERQAARFDAVLE